MDNNKIQKIAILTSGGDAPGMNVAIRTAVKTGVGRGVEVFGVEQGYDGLMAGHFTILTPKDVDSIGSLGGTILGSARSADFMKPEGRRHAAEQLRSAGIGGLLVIGGNGSLTGAHHLHAETEFPVVGIPASIDNDIGCTSNAIGVDTALNTIVDACDRISDTARAHRRVFIVEVMGRECGYLAMNSAVAAGADAVLFREAGKDEETLVEELEELMRRSFDRSRDKRRILVIKAEGVEVPTDQLVHRLQLKAKRHLPGVDVRGTTLGHLVRGGSPTFRDRMVAGRLTWVAVNSLVEGITGSMVAWHPTFPENGAATADPNILLYTFEDVLGETARILDGTSPVTRRRLRMIEDVEGVLGL